jgi:hypothetical protein
MQRIIYQRAICVRAGRIGGGRQGIAERALWDCAKR